MADNADIAADITNDVIAAAARAASAPIAPGAAGECDGCEWWMPRLVDGLCGFCRDGRARPADWEPPTPPQTTPQSRIEKDDDMTELRKIAFTGDALHAIDALATKSDLAFKDAAAELIIRGAGTAPVTAATDPAPAREVTLISVVGDLHQLFDGLAVRADRPDLTADLAAMTARAEAAEQTLARVQAAFG